MKQIIFISLLIAVLLSACEKDTTSFVSVWKTTKANEKIELPLHDGGVYDFTVNWGDGSSDHITEWNAAERSHSYTKAGEHTLTIRGQLKGFSFYDYYDFDNDRNGTPEAIIDVSQWGTGFRFGNKGGYFAFCQNLKGFTATDAPNLTGTTNMLMMFGKAAAFNGDISNWDVSAVTEMLFMFAKASAFNQDISGWNVSAVTTMSGMFWRASAFNQNISNWNVSQVTNMYRMFSGAKAFNQDLSGWDMTTVTNMEEMFFRARAFNQNLSSWNVSQVTNSDHFDDGATAWTNPAWKPNFR